MSHRLNVGEFAEITRKPLSHEPLSLLWTSAMDAYLGSVGVVTATNLSPGLSQGRLLLVPTVVMKHWDLTLSEYPEYCLSFRAKSVLSELAKCSCQLELLLARGCKCGALDLERMQEKRKKIK